VRRSVIAKMGLRDQPILDQYQDEIFRLPLDNRLLILGPPGTGKTTTLIRRLGQKLDLEFLDDEERHIVDQASRGNGVGHADSWMMFTPTELLKQYLKEAFARERVPAPDQRIRTWSDYRRELGRNTFGILRTAAGGGSLVLRENLESITSDAVTESTSWFSDFYGWQREPFDPLPAKSPGMLPDGAAPFHVHAGILVNDQGHPHDLARLIEEVLVRIEVPVPEDVRRWLQRDFFAFHLQRYSKSRRKAPIYWPLATSSGSYTLWVYYPSLTSQTLYTAINDFVEPKLKQVGADVTALRNKGSARTRNDEKQFEVLRTFELELIEMRDTLLKLAPAYKPNHDDGVQIAAAPLWPLFRHKPWQKVLKDTWTKLEKGDYDWAHLAMNYWPERVREKCKTDKSLAIAHGLEDLYVELEAKPKQARRGKQKAT
jgi:DNA polymerase III delta prime subunit